MGWAGMGGDGVSVLRFFFVNGTRFFLRLVGGELQIGIWPRAWSQDGSIFCAVIVATLGLTAHSE